MFEELFYYEGYSEFNDMCGMFTVRDRLGKSYFISNDYALDVDYILIMEKGKLYKFYLELRSYGRLSVMDYEEITIEKEININE